jgi:hypothetical protein
LPSGPGPDGELGTPVREYLPRRWSLRLAIAAGVFVLAFFLAILSSRLKETVTVPDPGNPEGPPRTHVVYKVRRGFRNIFNMTVLVGFGAVVYYLVWTLRTFRLRVVVCENGLLFERRWSRTRCLWADVKEVYHVKQRQQLLVSWTTWYCRVVKRNGEEFRFPSPLNFLFGGFLPGGRRVMLGQLVYQVFIQTVFRNPLPGIGELCDTVLQKTRPLLLAEMPAALDRGERVSLGPIIQIGPEGVRFRNSVLPWGDLDLVTCGGGVGMAAGILRLRQKSSQKWWLEVGSAYVANRDALLAILKQKYRIPVEQLDEGD